MAGVKAEEGIFDLAVIGGGINGCGIARDAAGRGLKVLVAEQGDLAGATSSASTKLIHGGLRYLEHYEFRLVREALAEREVLLRAAPHIIRPLRFVLPHHRGLRPWPILRIGLFLYDHLGGRKLLPPTRSLDLTRDEAGTPLKPQFTRAFEYSDCWVDDARLVVLNARDAADKGARIRTRTRCISARREHGHWRLQLRDSDDGTMSEAAAKVLVNTAGPWVSEVLGTVIGAKKPDRIRLVKGSHLVVDKLFDHDRCYIFQNADGRICFAIPYERDFTLIGTTDEDYRGDPGSPHITDGERDYLLGAAGEYFKTPVKQESIRWTYSGVRPLYDDGASRAQEATRDYVLKLDAPENQPPVLSVYGGKITTFRRLAETVMEKIEPFFPGFGRAWTATVALPGGDFAYQDRKRCLDDFARRYAFLPPREAERLFGAYGTHAETFMARVRSINDMGRKFGAISECEVRYLVKQEWARTAEDILWRRTKLGLRTSESERAALQDFLKPESEGLQTATSDDKMAIGTTGT